ncbi:MAG: hypothetical protein F6K47_36695 [Symploca sp. SIO2E6]|nr:hypothetical protein [Symploca sp. SIO2E6]
MYHSINWDLLKSHYLQANRATQLDSLALNLMRIGSGTDDSVAQYLVRESQFFIEWIIPDMDLETDITFASELVDLQRLLSRWKLSWSDLWLNEKEPQEVAMLAQQWCNYIHG